MVFFRRPDLWQVHLLNPVWQSKAVQNSSRRLVTAMTSRPSSALASRRHNVAVEAKSLPRTAKAIAGPAVTIVLAARTRVGDLSTTLLSPCIMIADVNRIRDSMTMTCTGLRCRKSSHRHVKERGMGAGTWTCTGLCLARRRMRGRNGGRDWC